MCKSGKGCCWWLRRLFRVVEDMLTTVGGHNRTSKTQQLLFLRKKYKVQLKLSFSWLTIELHITVNEALVNLSPIWWSPELVINSCLTEPQVCFVSEDSIWAFASCLSLSLHTHKAFQTCKRSHQNSLTSSRAVRRISDINAVAISRRRRSHYSCTPNKRRTRNWSRKHANIIWSI